MKCDKCTNSLKGMTGVPSCWLPRCPYDRKVLIEQYRGYAIKPSRTPSEERCMHELERMIKQQIHDDIGARWYEDHSPKIEKEKKQWKS